MTTPTQHEPEADHDSGTGATDPAIRKKYLLIPKRSVWWCAALAVVTYLGGLLWSEFVYSVSTSSEKALTQFERDIQRIPCSSDSYRVDSGKVPKRNPWLFESYHSNSRYMDVLFDQPGCASRFAVGTLTNPHGKFSVYYFDRATDKPVIKVTYESLK